MVSSPKKINVLQTSKHGRCFLVYDGIPFYQSSGRSSGFAETWFPCFGIQCKNNPYNIIDRHQTHHSPGWIIKGYKAEEIFGVVSDIATYQNDTQLPGFFVNTKNFKGKTKKIEHFFHRMSYKKALRGSACLGGGIWKSPFGEALSARLHSELNDNIGFSSVSYNIINEESYAEAHPSLTQNELINTFIQEQKAEAISEIVRCHP